MCRQYDSGCPHRVHRVATAAFWRTFSHEGKISPGWWGWGVHAHPLSLHLPSPVKLQCMLQLSGQIHWPCFISTNMYSVVVLIDDQNRVVDTGGQNSVVDTGNLSSLPLTSVANLLLAPLTQVAKLPRPVSPAINVNLGEGVTHRWNMELDLQSLFGLLCTAVLIGRTPQLPPPSAFGLLYEGAIGQSR
jgi:hypothetical protein